MALGRVRVTVMVAIAMDPAEITSPAARMIPGINQTPVVKVVVEKAVAVKVEGAAVMAAVEAVEEENSPSPCGIGLTVKVKAAGVESSPAAVVSIVMGSHLSKTTCLARPS